MASPPCGRQMSLQMGSCAPNQQHPVASIKGTVSSAGLKGLLTHTLLGSGLVLRLSVPSLPRGLLPRLTPQPHHQPSHRGERSPPAASWSPGLCTARWAAGTSGVEEGRAGEQVTCAQHSCMLPSSPFKVGRVTPTTGTLGRASQLPLHPLYNGDD